MADKSPHMSHSANKSGKAIKAKRTQRKEKARATVQMEQLMHPARDRH